MTVLSKVASFRIQDTNIIDNYSTTTNNSLFENPSYSVGLLIEPFDSAISITSVNSISIENQETINTIKSFKSLDNNWDEDGAQAISLFSIYKSIEIVKMLDRLNIDVYLAAPGPNKEILLMVKTSSKELELIIYPNKMKFVKFENNEFISQGDFSIEEIPSLYFWTQSV